MERTPEIRALEKYIWYLEEEIKLLQDAAYIMQEQIRQAKKEVKKNESGSKDL